MHISTTTTKKHKEWLVYEGSCLLMVRTIENSVLCGHLSLLWPTFSLTFLGSTEFPAISDKQWCNKKFREQCEIIENTLISANPHTPSPHTLWFLHRTPRTLVNSEVIRALSASFVLMRQLWVGLWRASGWKLVTRKSMSWLGSLVFFTPFPHPSETGEELDTELIVDHTYVRKPP